MPDDEEPRPGRRGLSARGARRRARILDAALDLVARAGAGELSMRAVADAAGVPLGSLTYYFASKEDLIEHALERAGAADAEWVEAVLAASPPRTVRQASRLIAGLVAEAAGPRRAGTVARYELWLQLSRHPRLRHVAARQRAALDELGRRLLAELRAPDPAAAAPLLTAAVDGLALRCVVEGGPSRRRLEEEVAALLAAALSIAGDARPGLSA